MEEDTNARLVYTWHSEHFINCDIYNKQCVIDYYKKNLKSETHIKTLINLIIFGTIVMFSRIIIRIQIGISSSKNIKP